MPSNEPPAKTASPSSGFRKQTQPADQQEFAVVPLPAGWVEHFWKVATPERMADLLQKQQEHALEARPAQHAHRARGQIGSYLIAGALIVLTGLFLFFGQGTLASLIVCVIPVAIALILALGRYNR